MNNDLISREALKKALTSDTRNIYVFECLSRVLEKIDNAPTVQPEYFPPCEDCNKKMEEIRRAYDKMKAMESPHGKWIPITYRPMTEEEVKRVETYFDLPLDEEEKKCFSCPMPEHGQEILISTKWGVYKDICLYDCDEGYSLDERGDWEDVDAWMPLPEPYKKEADNE